jgi:hypothetical protein
MASQTQITLLKREALSPNYFSRWAETYLPLTLLGIKGLGGKRPAQQRTIPQMDL